jgi:predicted dienelactone hydrolase
MRLFIALAAALALHSLAWAAPPFTAGERHLATTTASAAVRNHGDGRLRITLWYPASAAEREVDIGPPGSPIFISGRTAADAPFADEARHPLILVSHGFGGSARQMTWLATALARAGYVVVGVDHPGTNGMDGVTAEGAYAPWERAGDLRAALDAVLADPKLASHIDERRIGVAGFSMGGFTSLVEVGARPDMPQLLAFCDGPDRDAICNPQQEFPLDVHQAPKVLAEPAMAPLAARASTDLHDPRVKAAFLIAPAPIEALNVESLRRLGVPLAIALGDADPIAPPKTNGERAAKLVPGATIDILPHVGHYDFLSECGAAGLANAKAYCTDAPGVSRAATHERVEHDAVAFFNKVLPSQAHP